MILSGVDMCVVPGGQFWLSQLVECYWRLVGRHQRCCLKSCNAQESLHHIQSSGPDVSVVAVQLLSRVQLFVTP